MRHNDYTSITELPAALLTPDQIRRFAHRYGFAYRLARGKRVLEVACGAGSGLNFLAQAATQTVGIDYSGGVLSYARQNSSTPLVQADAQQLPFAHAYFDLILCFEAIYYLREYLRFLAECRRLLAAGGTLLICQSNPDWPHFVPGALTTRYPNLPELVESLYQSGFGEVSAYGTLPITAAGARQRAVNTLRRWVLKSSILPLLGPLKPLLQQVSYGRLYPLPPAIDEQWVAAWQGDLTLTPLVSTEPDHLHRVIYVQGRI
jgi:ubiquinone/menaquinone biosynthesis C-methylase UbiE